MPALTLADAVHSLATELTQKKNVKHVSVCSCIPRTTNLSLDMNEDTFRIKCGNFNNILKHFCETTDNVIYWTQRVLD